MKTSVSGEKDPVQRLQQATLVLLQTEIGRWRKAQLIAKRQKTPPDPGFAETLGMLSRSVGNLTDAVRKGGKEMRERDKKLTTEQRVLGVVEFLRELPPTRLAEVLANLGVQANHG